MTTYTTSLRFPVMTPGDPAVVNAWGTILNGFIQVSESAITGNGAINIAGLTTYTLTVADDATDQARQAAYVFTGALTANCTVTMPAVPKIGYATNSTTGGFGVILTTGGGTTLTVPAGLSMFYTCDGTNVATLTLGVAGLTVTGSISGPVTFAGSVAFGSNAVTGSNFAVTGGSVNATTIGATTPAAGTFTTLTVNTSLVLPAPLAIASGGTGQITAAAALTALGGAALAGSAGQVFNVATAITATEAVPLAQVGAPNRVQVFVSNGSWTAPAGVTSALVTAVGGGGGGGGGSGSGSGSGGGSGAVIYRQLVAVVPGTPYTVTIGTAGTGGAVSTGGAAGTATSLGALVSAPGGSPGASPTSYAPLAGGLGGSPGGQNGAEPFNSSGYTIGAAGGATMFGPGGLPAGGGGGGTPVAASGFGGGGAGGVESAVGGNGSPGLLIVEF